MAENIPGTSIENFTNVENWQTSPNCRISQIDQGGTILWQVNLSKTDNIPSICCVNGFSVPANVELRVKIFPKNPFLLFAMEDSDGKIGLQAIPSGLVPNVWNEIRVRADKLPVMGSPEETLNDVVSLIFIVEGGAGEMKTSGEYSYCFREACLASSDEPPLKSEPLPKETINPYEGQISFDEQEFRRRWKKMEDKLAETGALLKQCESEGHCCDYQKASLALFFDRDAVVKDFERGLTGRATGAIIFYENCLFRTELELRRILEGKDTPPEVPEPNMKNIEVREGFFYADEQPVILTGLVGWGLKQQLPLLRDMGFNFFSIETGIRANMPDENQKMIEPNVLESLRAAEVNNMAMDLLISPHYFPQWAYEKYPGIDRQGFRRRRGMFSPWNVSDQEFREIVKDYVSFLIPKVKDAPALVSIDQANEVWWELGTDYPVEEFRDYLRNKYDKLANLNRTWGTKFKRWNQVNISGTRHASWVDFNAYNQARLADFYSEYADAIRKAGWNGTIYAKVIGSEYEVMGVNKDRFTENLSGSGTDCYPRYKDPESPLAAYFHEQQSIIDLYKSCYPDKPVLDTEYHIIFYHNVVSPEYIQAMMWDGAIHGRCAAAVWAWSRNIENEAQSLFTQPWAVEALSHASLDLRRFAGEVEKLQRVEKVMAVYYSGPRYLDVYEEAYFTGIPFDVLTPERCEPERLNRYKIIVIPDEAIADEQAMNALIEFVKNGGALIMGDNAMQRTLHGKTNKRAKLFQQAWDSEKCLVFHPGHRRGDLTNRIHFFTTSLMQLQSRPVLLTGESGTLVRNVTWRAIEDEEGLLLFTLNYGHAPVAADIFPTNGQPMDNGIDLLTGYHVGNSIKLPSLVPRLLRYRTK